MLPPTLSVCVPPITITWHVAFYGFHLGPGATLSSAQWAGIIRRVPNGASSLRILGDDRFYSGLELDSKFLTSPAQGLLAYSIL
jgi:hypothetical protein